MKSRFLLLGACALLLGGRAHAQLQVGIDQNHRHVYKTTPTWSDEFNGTAVDLTNWRFEGTNVIGQMNGEQQYYQDNGANAWVANGKLTIQARKEAMGGLRYTSARMTSKGKREFQYGKIEAMIEVPMSTGAWPAFWMLGANDGDPNFRWPKCGEIDIMERVNNEDFVHSTQHWYDPNDYADNGHVMEYKTSKPLSNGGGGYHKYTIEWDDVSISTWVDDVKYHDFPTNGMTSPTPHPTDAYKKPFYILLNLALGGQMTGYVQPDESKLPASMNVDYVRVYDVDNGTPPPPPPPTTAGQLEAENANVKSGMTAEACSEGGQDMGYIQQGGFLTFNSVNFPTTGTYLVEYRVASGGAGGTISCDLNGGTIPLGTTTIPGTGGWQTWQTVSKVVNVNAGTYNFGVFAQTAGYNLNWVRITPQAAQQQLEAENANVKSGMTAEACSEGGQDMGYIQQGGFLTFNTIKFPTTGNYLIEYRVASGGAGGTISCDLNGGTIPLGTTAIPGTGGWQTWQTVSRTVSVNAGTYNFGVYAQTAGYNLNWVRITPQGGTPPPPFSKQLEAESANVTQGMTAEGCSEGGQDMGYIQQGGFLTFNNITFPTTGTYLVEYRVASGGAGGTISCDLNGGTISLGLTNIPGTGGWQTWTTVSRTVTINAGTYNFGVYAQTAGYNLNWIRITKQGAARGGAPAGIAPAGGTQPLRFYPNPVTTSFVVDGLREAGELTLRDYLGRICLHQQVEANERVDISALPVGIYVLTVRTAEGQLVQKLVKQ